MRKLLSSLYTKGSEEENSRGPTIGFSAIISGRSRNKTSTPAGKIDNAHQIIQVAASNLAESIQGILSNIANYNAENLSDYQHLLEILDPHYHPEDETEIKNRNSADSIIQLLDYLEHPNFIEATFDANLATGLYQALRLLRMLELIQAKSQDTISAVNQMQDHGITFAASLNITRILEKICTSPVTIEQLRPSLVKLLTFPLNSLPPLAKHLQIHSTRVAAAICRVGFTSQQVWFLHDCHYINYALRALSELTEFNIGVSSQSKEEGSQQLMLKGKLAETEGMWLEAVKCVVEVMNASLIVSPALITDFESLNGSKIFVHILNRTSPDRLLRSLNIFATLIYHTSKKDDDPHSVHYNHTTAIFADFLNEVLQLSQCIVSNESVETMIHLSQQLIDGNYVHSSIEYIFQGLSYAILTMYSNDSTNCLLLEEKYHILPTLMLCLPGISSEETVSAVLTTFNYICQCVESSSSTLFSSMNASICVMITVALNRERYSLEQRNSASHFMELCFSSIDAITRSNAKYAVIFMRHGLLKNVVADTFEQLITDLKDGFLLDESSILVFERILTLLTDLIGKSPMVAEEARSGGLNPILSALIAAPNIPAKFASQVLIIFEELAKVMASTSSLLEESVNTIAILVTNHELLEIGYEKLSCLFESLWRILLNSEGHRKAISLMREVAAEACFAILLSMKGAFHNPSLSESNETTNDHIIVLHCLESMLKFLSIYLFFTRENHRDAMFLAKIAYGLVQTEVFMNSQYATHGILLLFDFATLFTEIKTVIDSYTCELLLIIPHYLNPTGLSALLSCMKAYFQTDENKCILFCENDAMVARFFEVMYQQCQGSEPLELLLEEILTLILRCHRSIPITMICQKYCFRPLVLTTLDNLDWVEMVAQGIEGLQEVFTPLPLSTKKTGGMMVISTTKRMNPLMLVNHFPDVIPCNDERNHHGFNVFGSNPSFDLPIILDPDSSECLSCGSLALFFNETTVPLPANAISISCWFKLDPSILTSNHFKQFTVFSLEGVNDRAIISLEVTAQESPEVEEFQLKFVNSDTLKEEIMLFQSPVRMLKPRFLTRWTHFVILLKRSKRFTQANQTFATVYVNGINCPLVTPQTKNAIDFDCLTTVQNGEIRLGFSKQNYWFSDTSNPFLGKIHYGGFTFFEEVITAKQIALLFFKGPDYNGLHQQVENNDYTEHMITFSAHSLRIVSKISRNTLHFLDRIGIKGLEAIVEPKYELHDNCVKGIDINILPDPVIVISPVAKKEDPCVLAIYDQTDRIYHTAQNLAVSSSLITSPLFSPAAINSLKKVHASVRPRRFSLINVTDLENENLTGVLTSPGIVTHQLSLGTRLAGLGGIETLLPLLFLCEDLDSLTYLFSVMQQAIAEDISVLKKAQAVIYRTIGFLCHYLGYQAETACAPSYRSAVCLESLLQFAVDLSCPTNKLQTVSLPIDSGLIVDTLAMAHLISNHHVWDVNRFTLYALLLKQLKALILDEKYKHVNAMKLSCLGFIRWILLATVNTLVNTSQEIRMKTDEEDKKEHHTSNTPNQTDHRRRSKSEEPVPDSGSFEDTWKYRPRTSLEMADFRDEVEDFLSDANIILRALLNSELRSKDLELLLSTIQFTFNMSESSSTRGEYQTNLSSSESMMSIPSTQSNEEHIGHPWEFHPFCTYEIMTPDPSNSGNRDSPSGLINGYYPPLLYYLNPFEFYRVYLLRLLVSLYDDNFEELRKRRGSTTTTTTANAANNAQNANGGGNGSSTVGNGFQVDIDNHFEIFRDKCSPEWFLSILERSHDEVATKAQTLRLLAFFLERDTSFAKEFIDRKGFQVLHSILCSEIQTIPVLLPLAAMLFRIPVQLLLYPFQLKTVGKVSQLLELEDSCSNDFTYVGDQWIASYSLPLLSIFYECLIKIIRRDRNHPYHQWGERAEELLVGILDSATRYCGPFKRLMQNRIAVEIHINAVISCSSTAFSDYGGLIYGTGKRESIDLTKAIIEEDYMASSSRPATMFFDLALDSSYFSSQSVAASNSRARASSNSFSSSSHSSSIPAAPRDVVEEEKLNQQDIVFIEDPISLSLQRMINYFLRHAIREDENSRILYHLFLSSSALQSYSYEKSYQMLIVSIFAEVAKESQGLENSIIGAIVRNITYIIPLARGLFFYDVTLLELLKVCIALVETISSMYEISELSDALVFIVRDLIGNARFLCFLLLHMQFNPSYKNTSVDRLTVLSFIRSKMDCLFHATIEDSIDSLISPSARFASKSTVDDMTLAATPMLEALQGLTGAASGSLSTQRRTSTASAGGVGSGATGGQVTVIRNERNRTSNAFVAYLANVSYSLVLDEEASVRIEATRIMAFLSQRRGSVMEQLVGNNSYFVSRLFLEYESLGVDIYREGLGKLVPNSEGKYRLFLQGGTDDNESEENRFADFSFWVSDNSNKCDVVFRAIDQALQMITPNVTMEAEDLTRKLKHKVRARDLFSFENAESVKASLGRQQMGQNIGTKFIKHYVIWKNEGLKELTSGAMAWKRTWMTLKSTPVWGYGRTIEEGNDDYESQNTCSDETPKKESSLSSRSSTAHRNFHGQIVWRVDYCEGPERCRKKLIQDLSTLSPVLFGRQAPKSQVVSPIPKVSLPGSNSNSPVRTPGENTSETTEIEGSGLGLDIGQIMSSEKIDDILSTMQKQGLFRRFSSARKEEEEGDTSMDYGGVESMLDSTATPDIEGSTSRKLSQSLRFALDEESRGQRSLEDSGDDLEVDRIIDGDLENNEDVMIDSGEDVTNTLRNITEEEEMTMSTLNKSTFSANLMAVTPKSPSTRISSTLKASRAALIKEVIKGIINTQELKNCEVYNIERIIGLETQKGIFILSDHFVHVLIGFVVKDRTAKFNDMQFEWIPQATKTARGWIETPKAMKQKINGEEIPEDILLRFIWSELLMADSPYLKIPIEEIYSFFKRRHQLKYCALEIADNRGASVLFACQSVAESDEILASLLEKDLPSSIFNKMIGLKNLQLLRGATNMYNRLISIFLTTITQFWQHGEITNFEYLMYINSAAGRSFLDLTQYPVFPWVLSDYKSEELDLDDDSIYRDLSKPMGAIGQKRAQQYYERYQTMDEFYSEGVEGSSPPFFYGTHYSCAGYVLHYLVRLQPYANMNLALQGGTFDKADRLFYNVESSWISASQENLQDVRELIPEFYYLPDFLMNVNRFEFGITQSDRRVDHVTLPPWAKHDPRLFIKLHRQALESRYVSEHLHHWIDLIFGFKQRGKAAIDAQNVFIHITYEGEVDLDAIDDPILQNATLSQINNFGQTPTRIFSKPHPRKIIPEVVKKLNDTILVEPAGLAWHGHLSPPLTVVGAAKFTILKLVNYGPANFQGTLPKKSSTISINATPATAVPVADMRLASRERVIACTNGSMFLPPNFKKIVRFKALVDGLVFQTVHTFVAPRLETERDVSYHEQLHSKKITCLAICKNGEFLATGSEDLSVRIWQLTRHNSQHIRRLLPVCTFLGHDSHITCLEISPEFNIVVSGGKDRRVIVWDYRQQCMIRILSEHTGSLVAVSINTISGNIITLTKEQLRIYHLNGSLISYQNFLDPAQNLLIAPATAVLAPPCGEWQDGVIAVTGHKDGGIYLWKLSNQVIINPVSAALSVAGESTSGLSNLNSSPMKSDPPQRSKKQRQYRFDHPGNSAYREVYENCPLYPTGGPYYSLFITSTLLKTHKAEITSLKLCSTNLSFTNKLTKELINKAYEESRNMDLLVGDMEGNISRWTIAKLDQLPQTDLYSLIKHEGFVPKN